MNSHRRRRARHPAIIDGPLRASPPGKERSAPSELASPPSWPTRDFRPKRPTPSRQDPGPLCVAQRKLERITTRLAARNEFVTNSARLTPIATGVAPTPDEIASLLQVEAITRIQRWPETRHPSLTRISALMDLLGSPHRAIRRSISRAPTARPRCAHGRRATALGPAHRPNPPAHTCSSGGTHFDRRQADQPGAVWHLPGEPLVALTTSSRRLLRGKGGPAMSKFCVPPRARGLATRPSTWQWSSVAWVDVVTPPT